MPASATGLLIFHNSTAVKNLHTSAVECYPFDGRKQPIRCSFSAKKRFNEHEMGRRANGGKGRLVVKLLPRLVLIRRHVCQYAGIIKQQKMHKERRRGDVARKNKHRRDVLAIYLYVPLLCSHRIKACPGSVEWTMEDGTHERWRTTRSNGSPL